MVLERLHESSFEDRKAPDYIVLRDGLPIGKMSDRFRSDLYRVLQTNPGFVPRSFPRLITGIRIQAVVPVAGGRAAGERAGLGPHGVWLAPRLAGLSRFEFDSKKG